MSRLTCKLARIIRALDILRCSHMSANGALDLQGVGKDGASKVPQTVQVSPKSHPQIRHALY